MRKAIVYICCACWLMMQLSCLKRNPLPDLRETYSSRDTKPFGSLIAKNILQNGFPENYVQALKDPFAKAARSFSDTASIYFSVSSNLYVDEEDVSAILNYVYEGNTAFFASGSFDTAFLHKIYCSVVTMNMIFENYADSYTQTSTSLIKGIHSSLDSFSYFYTPFANYFSETNDIYSRIAGYNSTGKPNCIVFFWGKGKLFLHIDPRAFSNYFLLTNSNYKYMQELMQVMGTSPQHVYWDDYYNRRSGPKAPKDSGSSLSEIFKYPGLKAAFWLMLSMLLFYILFAMKRKQRIIKQIKPNQNSSVAFTETIARLYLQKHDNKNIADKMITYFNEFIRNNYFLNTNVGSKDFITTLSRKSGVSEEKTEALFNTINKVTESNTIDDLQLLSLNEQIQHFYKKRK